MSAESRIDTVDNIWGDETPDAYDRVFAGLDEYMDDIHGRFNRSCLPSYTKIIDRDDRERLGANRSPRA
jgi:hypothetical protein